MSTNWEFRTVDPEYYVQRAHRLRSEAAASAFAWIGRTILTSIRRAYIRPYRMTRIPGCGCEA